MMSMVLILLADEVAKDFQIGELGIEGSEGTKNRVNFGR
jgi:hypothetical protein